MEEDTLRQIIREEVQRAVHTTRVPGGKPGGVIYHPHLGLNTSCLFEVTPCETCRGVIAMTLDGTPFYGGQLFGFIHWCRCIIEK